MAEKAIPNADNWRLLEVTCSRYMDEEAVSKIHEAYHFAAEFHKAVEHFLGFVPLFFGLFLPFVGQFVPALQAVIGRESEMLFAVAKPGGAIKGELFQCFFFCHDDSVYD